MQILQYESLYLIREKDKLFHSFGFDNFLIAVCYLNNYYRGELLRVKGVEGGERQI